MANGVKVEAVTDVIFLGTTITGDSDSSNEIQRRLLLGREVMTNLNSILKSRDITLLTKVHMVKAVVFPVVMYRCESWSLKKAEQQRIDAFQLWCWRRLFFFFNFNFLFFLNFKIFNSYMRSQTWTTLPPPSPQHLSGSSPCTSPKHAVSCVRHRLAIQFLHDSIRVIIPILPNHPTLSLSLWVQKSIIHSCVFFPVLHTGSSLPSF